MTLTEYELRQLLYFHYNNLEAFTIEDILRKAKMSLNRNTSKDEIEKLLNKLEVNNVVNKNESELQLSKKLIRNKCQNCTFIFYLSGATECPNCGSTLQELDK